MQVKLILNCSNIFPSDLVIDAAVNNYYISQMNKDIFDYSEVVIFSDSYNVTIVKSCG